MTKQCPIVNRGQLESKNYTNYIQCICGYQGLSIETRQHRECPKCHTVVEACCEGNSCT